jgi:hypothetical protein
MNKIFTTTVSLALTMAASLLCASAHAAQQPVDATAAVAASISAAQPVQQLTRAQVYQQLIQAQKDGSLARANATYNGA